MYKKDKIIYWVSTCWLALGMISTGIVQIMHMKEEVDKTSIHLGFPLYFLTFIGIAKLSGAIAVLIPKFPLIKEWAYAGFFFLMTGAIVSHIAMGDSMKDLFGPALLLVLISISWYYRPSDRKLI